MTLKEASEILKSGKLVSFPTETVYGLGANALNAEACLNIFTTKGRPLTDPLIVHVHSLD
jgi:L-threonylcarbamoyladenylate synthase